MAGVESCRYVNVDDLTSWNLGGQKSPTEGTIPASIVTHTNWAFTIGRGAALLEKLKAMPRTLENVTDRIFQGIKTSADKIYIVEEVVRKPRGIQVLSRETGKEHWLEPDLLHPLIKGGDSKRYRLTRTRRHILFPYAPQRDGKMELIPSETFKVTYPLTWAYLLDNKTYLENREDGKMRGPKWYGYVYPKALDVMSLPKLFTPDIAEHASFSLDETGEVFFTGGAAGGYGILVRPEFSREYILACLNSRLLEWFIRQTATRMQGGYYSFESRFIRHLPICFIDLSDPAEKARHDRMVTLVESMLSLNIQLAAANTDHEKTALQRQIDATDRQIDQLVYELYGLTDEEIAIVESATGPRK